MSGEMERSQAHVTAQPLRGILVHHALHCVLASAQSVCSARCCYQRALTDADPVVLRFCKCVGPNVWAGTEMLEDTRTRACMRQRCIDARALSAALGLVARSTKCTQSSGYAAHGLNMAASARQT